MLDRMYLLSAAHGWAKITLVAPGTESLCVKICSDVKAYLLNGSSTICVFQKIFLYGSGKCLWKPLTDDVNVWVWMQVRFSFEFLIFTWILNTLSAFRHLFGIFCLICKANHYKKWSLELLNKTLFTAHICRPTLTLPLVCENTYRNT